MRIGAGLHVGLCGDLGVDAPAGWRDDCSDNSSTGIHLSFWAGGQVARHTIPPVGSRVSPEAGLPVGTQVAIMRARQDPAGLSRTRWRGSARGCWLCSGGSNSIRHGRSRQTPLVNSKSRLSRPVRCSGPPLKVRGYKVGLPGGAEPQRQVRLDVVQPNINGHTPGLEQLQLAKAHVKGRTPADTIVVLNHNDVNGPRERRGVELERRADRGEELVDIAAHDAWSTGRPRRPTGAMHGAHTVRGGGRAGAGRKRSATLAEGASAAKGGLAG